MWNICFWWRGEGMERRRKERGRRERGKKRERKAEVRCLMEKREGKRKKKEREGFFPLKGGFGSGRRAGP